VRCAATLKSGQPCGREARSPSDLCQVHAHAAERRDDPRFYAKNLSPDERQALATAAELEGVDAEIALLRILIRRIATTGDIEQARRGIDTLCRTLKARHALDDRSADQLATSLERLLTSLGDDLGVSL
jgi:hypothetical protein